MRTIRYKQGAVAYHDANLVVKVGEENNGHPVMGTVSFRGHFGWDLLGTVWLPYHPKSEFHWFEDTTEFLFRRVGGEGDKEEVWFGGQHRGAPFLVRMPAWIWNNRLDGYVRLVTEILCPLFILRIAGYYNHVPKMHGPFIWSAQLNTNTRGVKSTVAKLLGVDCRCFAVRCIAVEKVGLLSLPSTFTGKLWVPEDESNFRTLGGVPFVIAQGSLHIPGYPVDGLMGIHLVTPMNLWTDAATDAKVAAG